jgi:hypothetical protein
VLLATSAKLSGMVVSSLPAEITTMIPACGAPDGGG